MLASLSSAKRVTVPRSTVQAPIKNRLLDALPRRDRDRLLASCHQVDLKLSMCFARPRNGFAMFTFPPAASSLSISPIDAAASLEVGLVGDEGMLGTSLVLGVNSAPQRALVQGQERLGGSRHRRFFANSSAALRCGSCCSATCT